MLDLGAISLLITTPLPLRSLNSPELTTRSPGFRPSTMLTKSPSGRPVRADVRQLPVRPGSFDAAICLCQGGFGLLGGTDLGPGFGQIEAAVGGEAGQQNLRETGLGGLATGADEI